MSLRGKGTERNTCGNRLGLENLISLAGNMDT